MVVAPLIVAAIEPKFTYRASLPNLAFPIHHDETLLASVNRFGKTDIYIYDIPRNALTPITNDDYDDLAPLYTWNKFHCILHQIALMIP